MIFRIQLLFKQRHDPNDPVLFQNKKKTVSFTRPYSIASQFFKEGVMHDEDGADPRGGKVYWDFENVDLSFDQSTKGPTPLGKQVFIEEKPNE